MIKTLGLGIWVCGVTLAAVFGMLEFQKRQVHSEEHAEEKALQQLKTKAINVPIINDGEIQGYMIAQFNFTIDQNVQKKIGIDPEVYLLDEAFKTIYAGEQINFRNLKKQDLPGFAKQLGANVNKRLGTELVAEVLIEQLAFVPKRDVRGPPKDVPPPE